MTTPEFRSNIRKVRTQIKKLDTLIKVFEKDPSLAYPNAFYLNNSRKFLLAVEGILEREHLKQVDYNYAIARRNKLKSKTNG